MVTFAAATKNSSSFPTRAPGQRRVDHFVAITCSVPSDSCDLRRADCRTHAQLVSPSRDPVGYEGSPTLLYVYCCASPLIKVDPEGMIDCYAMLEGCITTAKWNRRRCKKAGGRLCDAVFGIDLTICEMRWQSCLMGEGFYCVEEYCRRNPGKCVVICGIVVVGGAIAVVEPTSAGEAAVCAAVARAAAL